MKCPKCNFENPAGAKFCSECATPLVAKKSATTYEGARKQVTIFFSDIKGSTALTENLDPEEARGILKPVLDAMFQAVHKFGGTILKAAGDGIMAVFGAPVAFEDHAVRACHAGLMLQKLMNEMNSKISVRIGINSGEVVLDVVNADLRKEYDALGPEVNIAARMEQTAEANAIQLAPGTYRLVKDIVNVHSRGKIPIKGLSEPMEVYELLGIKHEFSRFVLLRSVHLSPFVGRKKEMDILDNALEKALKSSGQVVAIEGEPGQGKSRLIYEFTNVSRAKDTTQYACQSQTIFQNNPFYVIKQSVKALFLIDENTSVQEQIKNIGEKVSDPYLKNIIFDVIGIPVDDKEWNELPSQFKRQEIIKGIALLIANQKDPLILLVEDVQWIDNESLECLSALIDNLAQSKVLLLLSFRPEFKPPWKNIIFISIKALAGQIFYELATSILGTDPKVEKLKKQIVERCNGNPFFLEETIRSLKDRNMLEGSPGNYQLLKPIEHIILPKTVQAVLDSRVDLLRPDQKKMLKVCAVIGKTIPINLLKYVFPIENHDFDSVLNVLSEKNFISKIQEFPELIYSFNHDVILESIYASLLKLQKRELHLSILHCLENKFPSEDLELLIRKADHAFRGENWEKAFDYYFKLQMKTYYTAATTESLKHMHKVADSFQHFNKPSKNQLLTYFNSIAHELNSYIHQARFSDMYVCVDEIAPTIKMIDDPFYECQFLVMIEAHANLGSGDYEEALRCCMKAKVIAGQIEKNTGKKNLDLEYSIEFIEPQALYFLGEYKRTREICEYFKKILSDPKKIDKKTGSYMGGVNILYLVSSLIHLGDFTALKSLETELRSLVKKSTPSPQLFNDEFILGKIYFAFGDFEQALTHINKTLEVALQLNIQSMSSYLFSMKGFILSLQNKPIEAKACLDKSYEISSKTNFTWHASEGMQVLCEAYRNIHDLEKTQNILGKMFEFAEKRKQKGMEAMAWRLKGLIEDNEEAFLKGIELAEKRGMLPETAKGYKQLAELYRKRGETAKAEEAMSKVRGKYEVSKMQL